MAQPPIYEQTVNAGLAAHPAYSQPAITPMQRAMHNPYWGQYAAARQRGDIEQAAFALTHLRQAHHWGDPVGRAVAPLEHEMFGRQLIQRQPYLAAIAPFLPLAYQAAKLTGLKRADTGASWAQMAGEYRGLGEGLMDVMRSPWGSRLQASGFHTPAASDRGAMAAVLPSAPDYQRGLNAQ
jgi:hypothetical protein